MKELLEMFAKTVTVAVVALTAIWFLSEISKVII